MKISKLSITESLLGESTSYHWIFLKKSSDVENLYML